MAFSFLVAVGRTSRTPIPSSSLFLRRWNLDWDSWCRSADAVEALARWADAEPELRSHTSSVAELLDACGRDRTLPVDVADRRLAVLAGLAAAGDDAATRVVVQRLLPALLTNASRRARRYRLPFDDVLGDLCATAWLAARTYRIDRRPAKVAVNLIADTVYRTDGYVPMVDRRTVLTPNPPDRPVPIDGRDPACRGSSWELVDVLHAALRAGVSADRLRLVAELGLVGLTPTQVAARDGVTDRTVRNRRQDAVAALRVTLGEPTRSAA